MGMVGAIDHASDPPPSLQKTAEHPTEKPGAPQKNCKVEGRSRAMVVDQGSERKAEGGGAVGDGDDDGDDDDQPDDGKGSTERCAQRRRRLG